MGRRWIAGTLAVGTGLLAACGSGAGPVPNASSPGAQTPSFATTGTAPATPGPAPTTGGMPVSTPSVDPALASLVATAVGDLTRRLGIDPGEVTVVSARSVTWPDGGLGCPQAGMVYAQVQVDGAKIELSARGTLYAYHSGGTRGLFLCEKKAT